MSFIEHGLAATLGFVTKPLGAAVTAVALTGAVAGGLYGTITELTTDLHTSEQNAADARVAHGRQVADLQNQVQVNANEARSARIRATRLTVRLEALQHEETGPLAPVLVRALDGVRDDLRGFSPA